MATLGVRALLLLALALLARCAEAPDPSADGSAGPALDGVTAGDGSLSELARDLSIPRGTEVCSDIAQAPDRVLFRSNQRTFNSTYYAIICGNQVYLRPNNERTGKSGPWQKLTGLPAALAGDVRGISLDDRFMMAANSSRRLWQMTGARQAVSAFKWNEYRGMPFGMGAQNYLPADALTWDQSVVSREEDGYYTDPAGNKHEVGQATCAHLIVLRGEGQWIAFNDAWLPADFNYEVCGPKRGRFKAKDLSASGSTFFLINKYGEMYTTLWDYDISGPNTVFYQYSYNDQKGALIPARQLPPAPWTRQPKIKGRITDRISMHKVGKDCLHRTLRVEGLDTTGRTGYYEKDIKAAGWTFHVTNRPVVGTFLDNRPEDMSATDLAPSEDVRYPRNMANLSTLSPIPSGSGITDSEWAAELLDFHCYCSPVKLRVHLSQGSTLDLVLHTTEALRLDVRTSRGLNDVPRSKNGAIEVPQATLSGLATLAPKAQRFIGTYLSKTRFTTVTVKATTQKVTLTRTGLSWEFSRP